MNGYYKQHPQWYLPNIDIQRLYFIDFLYLSHGIYKCKTKHSTYLKELPKLDLKKKGRKEEQ